MNLVRNTKLILCLLASMVVLHCSKGADVSLRHGIEIEDEKDSWGGAVPITGGWLTYKNARVQCGLQTLDSRQYKINCQALAEMDNGNEVVPRAIESGLRLNWGYLRFSNDMLIENYDCTASKDQLTNQCILSTKSDSDIKVNVQLKIASSNQSRKAEASVLLPYSVELTAGPIPSMRQSSVQESFGLENLELPATSTDIQSSSICTSEVGIFVTHANHVFRIPKNQDGLPLDKLQLFLGSHLNIETCSLNATTQNCRPLDMVLGNKLSLSCTEKGLYVSDVQNSRLIFAPFQVKEGDSGPFVKYIANISDQSCINSIKDESRTQPSSLAVEDSDGSLVFADTCRHLIVRIDKSGAHSVIGGTGAAVRTDMITVGARANLTNIYKPHAIGILSNGDVVFGHWDAGIYRISAQTKEISLIAKLNTSYGRVLSADYPLAIAVEKETDAIFVSDIYNHRIFKVLKTGEILHFAGNPTNNKEAGFDPAADLAKNFKFFNPISLALDVKGELLVSDFRNAMIDRIYSEGEFTKVKIIGGKFRLSGVSGMPASKAKLRSIYGMAYSPDGELYFATTFEHRIKKLVGEGKDAVVEIVGGNPGYYMVQTETSAAYNESVTSNALLDHKFSDPSGLTFDKNGNLYIADRKAADYAGMPGQRGYIVRVIDGIVNVVRLRGTGEPTHVAVSDDDLVYGLSSHYKAVYQYDLSTGLKTTALADLQDPKGMVFDRPSQKLLVADGISGRLFSIDKQNIATDILEPNKLTSSSLKVVAPSDLTITSDGTIYVVDGEAGNNSIKKIRKTKNGLYEVSSLFGEKNDEKCSIGLGTGEAVRGDIDDGIKMSLSGMCRGEITSIASKDTCASEGASGLITLSFAQKFRVNYVSTVMEWGSDEYGSHIITIKRPCHDL